MKSNLSVCARLKRHAAHHKVTQRCRPTTPQLKTGAPGSLERSGRTLLLREGGRGFPKPQRGTRSPVTTSGCLLGKPTSFSQSERPPESRPVSVGLAAGRNRVFPVLIVEAQACCVPVWGSRWFSLPEPQLPRLKLGDVSRRPETPRRSPATRRLSPGLRVSARSGSDLQLLCAGVGPGPW